LSQMREMPNGETFDSVIKRKTQTNRIGRMSYLLSFSSPLPSVSLSYTLSRTFISFSFVEPPNILADIYLGYF
jgi:hypothetical protein